MEFVINLAKFPVMKNEDMIILHHTTVILMAVAFPILISPVIYLYYFKECSDNHLEDINNEFQLFLADMLTKQILDYQFCFLYVFLIKKEDR